MLWCDYSFLPTIKILARKYILGSMYCSARFRISTMPLLAIKNKLCVQIHSKPNSKTPLSQIYRNSWPDPPSGISPLEEPITLPKRTVPESALRFKLSSSFEHGSAIYFPHLKLNPADCKVTLYVSLDDLHLTPIEESIFKEMVGPRFNQGKREVRLISNRFPNRIENKRYLVYLLENLLTETRRLNSMIDQYS